MLSKKIKEQIAEISTFSKDNKEAKDYLDSLTKKLAELESDVEKSKKTSLGEQEEPKSAKELNFDKLKGDFNDYAKQQVDGFFNKMFTSASDFFTDIFNEAKSMIDEIASYSLGTSLFSNQSARQQAMTYGLTDASNYALTQTMSVLKMQSEEDLLYMNDNQKEWFEALMDKCTSLG